VAGLHHYTFVVYQPAFAAFDPGLRNILEMGMYYIIPGGGFYLLSKSSYIPDWAEDLKRRQIVKILKAIWALS